MQHTLEQYDDLNFDLSWGNDILHWHLIYVYFYIKKGFLYLLIVQRFVQRSSVQNRVRKGFSYGSRIRLYGFAQYDPTVLSLLSHLLTFQSSMSHFMALWHITAFEWLISFICFRMEVSDSSVKFVLHWNQLKLACPWNIRLFIASHRYLTRVPFQRAPTHFLEQSLC